MGQSAISCRNITFRYFEKSKPILEKVSLELPVGEISVLMGSSGCGKSTLAAVLCGLLPENGGFLSEGTIELFGKPLQQLYFCMENISMPREEMKSRAEAAARAIGMEELLDRPLHTLSGGEKQRAVLACIYLLDAKCILLDEPFANLDPPYRS